MATAALFSAQREVQYLTKDGEVLDLIVWNYYGRTLNVVEQVLLRNRLLLSAYGAILPAGLIIVLPVVPLEINQSIKLWDYSKSVESIARQTPMTDTLAIVQAALASYRLQRGLVPPTATPPVASDIIMIGDRVRLRKTSTGSVTESLGADNVWRVEDEIKAKGLS